MPHRLITHFYKWFSLRAFWISGTDFMHSRARTHTLQWNAINAPSFKKVQKHCTFDLVLRLPLMEFGVQFRLCAWTTSNSESFPTFEYSSSRWQLECLPHRLITFDADHPRKPMLSLRLGSVCIPLCRCSLPVHKRTRRERERERGVKGLSRFFWSMITSRHHTKPFLRKLSRIPMPHNFTNILIINPQHLTLSDQLGLKLRTTQLRFLSASHHTPQCQCTKC